MEQKAILFNLQENQRKSRNDLSGDGVIDLIQFEESPSKTDYTGLKRNWSKNDQNVLIKITKDEYFITISTYDRPHGHRGRFLIKPEKIYLWYLRPAGTVCYEKDCESYVAISENRDGLEFDFSWLSSLGGSKLAGFSQKVVIPAETIQSVSMGEVRKCLYVPPARRTKIVLSDHARETISEIRENKLIFRAFLKAMRDFFQWTDETVTLYPDGKYSFYFITESGFPINGGLILHEGTKNGHRYFYYCVHT